ncbi:hypothetical protein [Endozoicomonas sp.]|uniref:hypothetical protein n=1 Tax=Endozoicomonas sp. TaxID=1892382 RepID=UPI00383BF62C
MSKMILSKIAPTIYRLLATLVALLLSGSFANADVSSSRTSVSEVSFEASHFDVSNMALGNMAFDVIKQDTPGCSDSDDSCLEKHCYSRCHTHGSSLVGSILNSYEVPYRDALTSTTAALYLSADMRSIYRPPIV